MTVTGGLTLLAISLLPVLAPAAATSVAHRINRRRRHPDQSDDDS
ncbi:hypothetical protein VST63_16990 [Mycolicibacterium sp. 050232]|nr:hypothetical protein [Mycolicibacterium sp. 050232]MED5814059.1 hypothetical protein [Mycolicibacterium sp. 050232]